MLVQFDYAASGLIRDLVLAHLEGANLCAGELVADPLDAKSVLLLSHVELASWRVDISKAETSVVMVDTARQSLPALARRAVLFRVVLRGYLASLEQMISAGSDVAPTKTFDYELTFEPEVAVIRGADMRPVLSYRFRRVEVSSYLPTALAVRLGFLIQSRLGTEVSPDGARAWQPFPEREVIEGLGAPFALLNAALTAVPSSQMVSLRAEFLETRRHNYPSPLPQPLPDQVRRWSEFFVGKLHEPFVAGGSLPAPDGREGRRVLIEGRTLVLSNEARMKEQSSNFEDGPHLTWSPVGATPRLLLRARTVVPRACFCAFTGKEESLRADVSGALNLSVDAGAFLAQGTIDVSVVKDWSYACCALTVGLVGLIVGGVAGLLISGMVLAFGGLFAGVGVFIVKAEGGDDTPRQAGGCVVTGRDIACRVPLSGVPEGASAVIQVSALANALVLQFPIPRLALITRAPGLTIWGIDDFEWLMTCSSSTGTARFRADAYVGYEVSGEFTSRGVCFAGVPFSFVFDPAGVYKDAVIRDSIVTTAKGRTRGVIEVSVPERPGGYPYPLRLLVSTTGGSRIITLVVPSLDEKVKSELIAAAPLCGLSYKGGDDLHAAGEVPAFDITSPVHELASHLRAGDFVPGFGALPQPVAAGVPPQPLDVLAVAQSFTIVPGRIVERPERDLTPAPARARDACHLASLIPAVASRIEPPISLADATSLGILAQSDAQYGPCPASAPPRAPDEAWVRTPTILMPPVPSRDSVALASASECRCAMADGSSSNPKVRCGAGVLREHTSR